MIAVTGATGQLGALVINHLLQHTSPNNIVALVRNPENAGDLAEQGVTVRHADYNQPNTLTSALQGVEKVLLISSNEIGNRVPQHSAVIQAAKQAQVKLFVYTSILKAEQSPLMLAQEHKITEQNIASANLPAVILRNGWYTENYTQNIPGILQMNAVAGTAENGLFYTAERNDYAEAAARILLATDAPVGEILELAGDHGFTLAQFAQAVAQQTKKEIAYLAVSAQDYSNMLIQAGLPEGFAMALADSEVHARNGWLAENSGALSKLLQRPVATLAQTLAKQLAC